MKTCSSRTRRIVIPVVLSMAVTLWGCASTQPGDTAATYPTDRAPSEVACELALIKLAGLIEQRSSQGTISPAALAEATELYRLGKQLYLEREYDLALELAEEGIQLLEE